MTMTTFWDLSEQARAALSREDVERYVDAELMLKGVLKVAALKLEPVEEVQLATRTVFSVVHDRWNKLDVAFETAEHAAAFLKLRPLILRNDYVGGQSLSYVETVPDGATIAPTQIATHEAIQQQKLALKRVGAAKDENRKRQEEHTKAIAAQESALEGLWEDWHRCRELDARMRRTVETFEDYKRVAGGDEAVAGRFLLKVFSREQIAEAAEWCGVAIPVPVIDAEFAEVDELPSPAPQADNLPAEF